MRDERILFQSFSKLSTILGCRLQADRGCTEGGYYRVNGFGTVHIIWAHKALDRRQHERTHARSFIYSEPYSRTFSCRLKRCYDRDRFLKAGSCSRIVSAIDDPGEIYELLCHAVSHLRSREHSALHCAAHTARSIGDRRLRVVSELIIESLAPVQTAVTPS